MDKCLTEPDLERYHAGNMPAEESAKLRRHLDACNACRQRDAEFVADHEDIVNQLRVLDETPPAPIRLDPATEDVTTQPIFGRSHGLSEPPHRIGPYRILGVIGEGGMGTVYRAEQERPRRTVALKVIKAGCTSADALKRFEQESHVLGRLQHPGIAQIFEAGVADTGRGPQPYFAMEFIQGRTLLDYAESAKLGTRQKLELFARIADAVQHAHAKGVIHRDLKPSNILVVDDVGSAPRTAPDAVVKTVRNADPTAQPKILDFGVARAIDSDLQVTTVQTDVGVLIGTIPYMSPEQVAGDPNELDTRSDVYALGVVLYELLAARLPYDLERKMIHEAVRTILEDEPTKLSSVNRALRGDIETIVGKALEKDKTRRYQTANALAADIRRYLSHEPIAARPPSALYQLRKFARRNKALVGGVAVSFLLLLGGIIGTSVGLARALAAEQEQSRERQRAEKALIAEEEQRRLAQENEQTATENEALALKRADETQQVADFQAEQLSGIDVPGMGVRLRADLLAEAAAAMQRAGLTENEISERRKALEDLLSGANLTNVALKQLDRDIFARALEAVEKFADQPLVKAQLLQTLAETLIKLGQLDRATTAQPEALAIRRRVLGDEHPDTLESINNMGVLLEAQGKLAEAEPYLLEALEKRRRVLGDEHPDTLESIHNMGSLLKAQGKLAEAEPYYLEALEKNRRVLGDEHPDTLGSINDMGYLLEAQGKMAEAEPYYREALEKRHRVLGDEHPDTLTSINNMGGLLLAMKTPADAEPYYRVALESRRRLLGDDHPDTLKSINNMGYLLHAQGKPAEAEGYFREALEKCRRVLGDDHPDTLTTINNLGGLLVSQGKLTEAEPYYREALEKFRRVLGDEHPNTLGSVNNMGVLLDTQGKLVEAEPYYREALEKRRRVLGDEHPQTLISIRNMGGLLVAQGKLAEAESLLLPGVQAAEASLPSLHPLRGKLLKRVGDLYDARHAAEPDKGYDAKAAEWRTKLAEWRATTQPSTTQPAEKG